MNRFLLFSLFLFLSNSLFSQQKEVPLDFNFSQMLRFDDGVFIELMDKDSTLVFDMNSENLDMPFLNSTFSLTKTGQYCLKTVIKTIDFTDSIERKFYFNVNGKEEKIRLEFTGNWDTLSKKPLNVYRNNHITLYKYTNGNPADLKLKRLWKKPSPDGVKLRLPYEIYNPSDKSLYSNEENGIAFTLEEHIGAHWNYLNCGAIMRLGKPFKPKQQYTLSKDGFVTGCDLAYLKGNEGLLRLKVEYHFHKADDLKREKIVDKKSIYTFKQFENFQFFDEFNVNQ